MKPMAVTADEIKEGEAAVGLLSLQAGPTQDVNQRVKKSQGRRQTLVCASVIGVAVLVVAIAGTRHAQESASIPSTVGLAAGLSVSPGLADAHHIRSQHSGRCLDWSSLIVRSVACQPSGVEQQMWTWDESNHRIRIPDGRCLDRGGKSVHIWNCSGSGYDAEQQLWQLQPGTGQIIHLKSQTCLVERSGKNSTVAMEPCDPTDEQQRWGTLGNAPLAMLPGQIMHAEGFCLDSGGSLHLWSCDPKNGNQHWEHDAATGEIKNSKGHCLDAGSIDVPQPCRRSDLDQQWAVRTSDGQLVVRNYFCLGALNPRQMGSPMQLSPCAQAKGIQRWDVSGLMSGSSPPVGLLSFLATSLLVLCAAAAVFFIQRRYSGGTGRDRTPLPDAEDPGKLEAVEEESLSVAEAAPTDGRQEEESLGAAEAGTADDR